MTGHFAVSDRGFGRAVLAACLWCLALWLVVGRPAAALDGAAIPDALDRTYREWMSRNRLTTGSLAVMKDGAVVKSFGYGGLAATQPALIASLSKAITAVCIARLVDEGRLSFTAPLATVLAPTFRKLGEPVDSRFKAITVEQLLKHRSGMRRNAPTEGVNPRTMSETFSKVLRAPLEWDADTRMSYSNIGYLTLGMVVEAITGEDYETRCRRTVLQPMKAFGAIAPELRWRAPNGGWQVSAIDYAKFMQVFDAGADLLGPLSRAWITAQVENGRYALGTFVQRTANGSTYWHSGSVVTPTGGGSYEIKFDNGWTVTAIFVRRVERSAAGDLRRRLLAAVDEAGTAARTVEEPQ